jgi:hypothetical protein
MAMITVIDLIIIQYFIIDELSEELLRPVIEITQCRSWQLHCVQTKIKDTDHKARLGNNCGKITISIVHNK